MFASFKFRVFLFSILSIFLAFCCGTSFAQQDPAPAAQGKPAANDTADLAKAAQNPEDTAGQSQSTATQQNPPPRTPGGGGVSARDLAAQANNPTAPLTLLQFRNILVPDVPGTNGVTNSLQMQPVVPIGPFKSFPFIQLIKITMPLVVSSPGLSPPNPVQPGVTGVGDLQVFDLVTIKQSWGKWGFGPALIFPTASANALGAGKWQAGPSVAIIVTAIKNLVVGAIVQNPISYAGSSDRSDVNNMIITPTLTYSLERGWFVGMSDYNWSFNWERGGAATIPLGIQVGKIVNLGKQPVSLSIEAGGTAKRPAGTPSPGWILGFELTPIFNWHLGPGQKIQLRRK